MATQTTTTLIDDIDGSAANDTYSFGLDGATYEIDLSEKNAERLSEALSAFVAAGRRVDSSRRSGRTSNRGGGSRQVKAGRPSRVAPDREQTTAIRNWARSQGLTVSDRGRLSQTIIDQFEAAH
jgi:hypothetical protein